MGTPEAEGFIDPNVDFDGALRAARLRQQQRRSAADQPRDDLGEPDEPAGLGSRRPLTDQIAEEAGGQPRDSATGQFLSPNDPLARFGPAPPGPELMPFEDPETIPPPEPEPEPEPPPAAERAERLLAGRFETAEELEQAYTNLESQQGRAGEELGSLRSTVEDLQRRIYMQQPPTAAAPQTPLSQEQLERGLAGQGREFLAGLYENEHPSYEDALDVALAVNPRLAVQWTSEVSAWEAEQRLRGELELRDRQISSLVTSSAAVTGRDAWGSAWRELAGENPEINQLADVMLADLQENQWLAGPVKEQLPGAEKLVIQNLLIRARDANADKVQEARRTQAEAIGREKTAATVASASGSSSPVAGEGGPTDESLERVRRLKAGILNASQGQNVHEAIHGPRT